MIDAGIRTMALQRTIYIIYQAIYFKGTLSFSSFSFSPSSNTPLALSLSFFFQPLFSHSHRPFCAV